MKIALLGNPNTGKSSIFNLLTGLKQHVGNFPGVTVDKKLGAFKADDVLYNLIDFPGTYSIYPHSIDEQVVYDVFANPSHSDYPDACVVVLDASNMRRNLFLFSQIYDLGLPTVMVLNMIDVAAKKQQEISIEVLQTMFPEAIITTSNARVRMGKDRIVDALKKVQPRRANSTFLANPSLKAIDSREEQEKEAVERYQKIDAVIDRVVTQKTTKEKHKTWGDRLDEILTHRIFGYLIFAAVLLLIFQFIFSFSEAPMNFIETQFGNLSSWVEQTLPAGLFNDLLAKGILPGIGGVVIFVPQIAILFFFLSILEETGYMARAVFIMDRIMRPFGLNGKSVVPLMSGAACAIPAIMSARTIPDWKERMITVFVTPLISCSARIPVYTLLIALVIPSKNVFGFINLQGLVMFSMYFLGIIAALGVAFMMKLFIKRQAKSFLLLEIPPYKSPRWGNVGLNVLEKVKLFVWNTGKIILSISIILWVMASYGPGNRMEQAVYQAEIIAQEKQLDEVQTNDLIASAQLENSYIGIVGKIIEPVIAPLGYDWKMGIALITSFAAREVFVGTLATIYSVHDDGDTNLALRDKLKREIRPDGTPVYSLATGLSLMVFYVFAMQCMATMAVVKRETSSWKWTFLQLGVFDVMAYVFAFVVFIIFS